MPGSNMGRDLDEETIRVVIGDDDPLAQRLLTEALQRGGIAVIAETTTGAELLDLTRFYHPDLVILGDRATGADSLEVTRAIAAAEPRTAIVLLAAVPDDAVGLRALRAGAAGYIPKGFNPDTLPQIVRGGVDGEAALSRRLAMGLVAWLLWQWRDRFRPGILFALYLVLSGLERFLVEFVRRNEQTVAGLTTPQVESLALMAVGTVWILAVSRRPGGLAARAAPA